MFIESRYDLPRLASVWTPVFDEFRDGRAFNAYAAGRPLAAAEPWTSADEVLLWGDVLRAVGQEQACLDLFRKLPPVLDGDLRGAIMRARSLSAEGRVLAALRCLDAAVARSVRSDLDAALVESERATELAGIHVAASAQAACDRVRESPSAGHPWVRYGLAHAYFRLRQWKQALDLFMGISVDCPHWPRPWALAHRCLASLGRSDDASNIITAAAERFPQDWRVFLSFIEDCISRNRWSLLADRLDTRLPEWSATVDDLTPLKALLVRAHWRSYETGQAVEVARTFDADLAAHLEKLRAAGFNRRFRLPVPALVQDRYLCVATSVAMILRLYGEGKDADPDRLNAEMEAQEGVSSWQLDRWCARRGLRAIDIRSDLDAIRGMLDERFPLLACRQGVLMSHMEVIVGYDDALEEIEVVDPDAGLPHFLPYAAVAATYTSAAEALVALLPDDDHAVLQRVDRSWIDDAAAIVRRARRKLHDGEIGEARAMLGDLPPGSRHRRFLTLEAAESFAPPLALRETLHALATDPDVEPNTRFNMALSLYSSGAESDAERIFAEFDHTIPRGLERYRRAMCSTWQGDMRRAGKRLAAIIERMPYAEDIWLTLATVSRALGRPEDADRALSTCLEMSPVHLGANLETLRLAQRSRPLDELAEDARALVDRHPRAGAARSLLAGFEFARGKPLAAESTWLEFLRLMPYSEGAFAELRQWYEGQQRPDLVEKLTGVTGAPAPVPSVDGNDARSLIRRAWDEYRTGTRGEATEAVAARLAAGELRHAHALEAILLEVNVRLREARERSVDADLDGILPRRLPDPVRDGLGTFLTRIDHRWTTPAAAIRIAAWADSLAPAAELAPEARVARTYLSELAGETNAARVAYLEIGERDRIDEAFFRAAVVAYRRGDFGDAVRDIRSCVALVPGSEDAWSLMAEIGQSGSSARHVLEGLERLSELRPYDENAAGRYLNALARLSGVDDARAWLDAASPRYTADFGSWWRLELHTISEEWADVLEGLDADFRSRQPRDAFTFEIPALRKLGREREFRERLALARDQFPDDPFLEDLHGEVLAATDPAAARDVYTRLLAVRPDIAAGRIVRTAAPAECAGVVLQSLGGDAVPSDMREAAIREFDDALSQPELAAARLAVFERLAETEPPSTFVLGALTSCYAAAGRWDDAERSARAAVGLDPYDDAMRLRLGTVLAESNPADAVTVLGALRERTGDSRVLRPLARALRRLGRTREAIDAFRAVLELDPSDADAVVALAELGFGGPQLFDAFQEVLRAGEPPDTPHFCTLAVESALAIGKPLLWCWERAAMNRYERLAGQDGPSDEREMLASMLVIWGGALDRPHAVRLVAPSVVRRIRLRAASRFRPWARNRDWMPTRRALERRIAVLCARRKAERESRAAES